MKEKDKPTKSIEVKLSKEYKSTELNKIKLKMYLEKITNPSKS